MTKPGDSQTKKTMHELCKEFPDRTYRELELYRDYRAEWYRRAKEFDPGDSPLAVCIELVSTCNLRCSMCYTITEEFKNSVIGAQRMMPWPIVKSMIDEKLSPGKHTIQWNAEGISSGLYLIVWSDGIQHITQKIVLLK